MDFQKLVDQLNNKEITPEQFIKQNQIEQAKRFAPQLMEHRSKGEWEKFISLALSIWELMPTAFNYYDEVPDSMKYEFAIRAYIHHGDRIPAVRKAVRSARRYGQPALPDELKSRDTITIYRAGEEPIEKAPYRISWTTEIAIAFFFLSEYIGKHATHLYKGVIRTKDIIAYTDDRNEREVMQYRKVYDLEDITPDAV